MSSRQQAEALVLVDEPNVRVTEHRFQPGAETGWRRHMADDVVVPLARHRWQKPVKIRGLCARLARLTMENGAVLMQRK